MKACTRVWFGAATLVAVSVLAVFMFPSFTRVLAQDHDAQHRLSGERQGFPTRATSEQTARVPGDSVSIQQFLTPDGRFDLEAARRSGYQGPLNLEGFESAIDPATGQPVFRPASPASPELNPAEQVWNHAKYSDLANFIPEDCDDLHRQVDLSLEGQCRQSDLLRSFFKTARLAL